MYYILFYEFSFNRIGIIFTLTMAFNSIFTKNIINYKLNITKIVYTNVTLNIL